MQPLPPHPPPLRAALLAQLGGFIAVLLLAFLLDSLAQLVLWQNLLLLALLQGGASALIAHHLGAPSWWLVIHLGFTPLAVSVHQLAIDPQWFLVGFVLLLLIFWRTDKSRVPLYLTNRMTAAALATHIPPIPCRVMDLGCGDAGVLRRLAIARPDCHFFGIEHAPLTWLTARLRTARLTNVTIQFGSFWNSTLADYSLVYAFLSPAPMPRLWTKAQAEMSNGALLASNSFTVPEVEPEQIVTVDDRRATHLFFYRIDKTGDSAAFPAIS